MSHAWDPWSQSLSLFFMIKLFVLHFYDITDFCHYALYLYASEKPSCVCTCNDTVCTEGSYLCYQWYLFHVISGIYFKLFSIYFYI